MADRVRALLRAGRTARVDTNRGAGLPLSRVAGPIHGRAPKAQAPSSGILAV
ncbi:hypothetical protein QBA57_36590 [Streptomyces scabiei]|uniref:hypothetical protein n=1 Tax=Streptomyces scabiei TaxID=1930 RepID=UPI001B30DAD3|nr:MULTISPECIES: hypothetical protein [Streptomyces]MDW8470376.1 hypothetical protein [Streptomyces scabiei]MDX2571053.1 hypothetical protein [Streptomyces scabiei]MDX2626640.1 hypothetical protein [Streptomyces scabiei]MDX3029588.1 hypothetical protein [Streptomyces scabiei]MDX3159161.1 hypothetical protein [Streptomyces scabiei]